MTKVEVMLAALAVSNGAKHSPVQVQKLLFLIDKRISDRLGGPFFNFAPYDYGPFDVDVYNQFETLAADNTVEIISHPAMRWKEYKLTSKGQALGDNILSECPKEAVDYIGELSAFVRGLSFKELISVIYKEYPEMKKYSVFQG